MTDKPLRPASKDAARWAAVFDAVVQAVVTIDAAGIIGSINPAGVGMFGYTAEELIGQNVKILMPHPDAGQHDDYLRDHLRTGVKKVIGIGREVVAKRKDGTTFPVHLSVGKYENDERTEFVGLIQDMTALREAQERLAERSEESQIHRERLERMDRISLAGEMASGIAHEVNQPLSAIANYSRALQHMFEVENVVSEDIKATVEKIRLQSHRAGEIVRRMRDFVSKHTTDPRPTAINHTVDEVLSFAELSSRGRKVSVELELASDLPDVLFDRVQLQQVILNLVNNAVEATQRDESPRIAVRSFGEESWVTLQIVDHGTGIDEATEARLFEPFFSNKRHGTGMGLAISRSIIEAQGGTIGFFPNPDSGVTFYIQIPALKTMEGDHE